MRRLAQRLAVPTLTRDHRQHLAAEVLAAADQLPAPRHRIRIAGVSGVLAAAAAAVVVDPRGRSRVRGGRTARAVREHPQGAAPRPRPRGRDARGARAPRPARIEDVQTRVIHEVRDGRDVLALADGSITIDSRDARDVDVRVADTVVHVNTARVRVHAHAGAILSVQVIAGSAEIETPARHVVVGPRPRGSPSPRASSSPCARSATAGSRCATGATPSRSGCSIARPIAPSPRMRRTGPRWPRCARAIRPRRTGSPSSSAGSRARRVPVRQRDSSTVCRTDSIADHFREQRRRCERPPSLHEGIRTPASASPERLRHRHRRTGHQRRRHGPLADPRSAIVVAETPR